MKTADINSKIIDSYISVLEHMSAQNKLELISKLTKSVKTDLKKEKTEFYKAFGAWDTYESAEELIESIKESRRFGKTIEKF